MLSYSSAMDSYLIFCNFVCAIIFYQKNLNIESFYVLFLLHCVRLNIVWILVAEDQLSNVSKKKLQDNCAVCSSKLSSRVCLKGQLFIIFKFTRTLKHRLHKKNRISYFGKGRLRDAETLKAIPLRRSTNSHWKCRLRSHKNAGAAEKDGGGAPKSR